MAASKAQRRKAREAYNRELARGGTPGVSGAFTFEYAEARRVAAPKSRDANYLQHQLRKALAAASPTEAERIRSETAQELVRRSQLDDYELTGEAAQLVRDQGKNGRAEPRVAAKKRDDEGKGIRIRFVSGGLAGGKR